VDGEYRVAGVLSQIPGGVGEGSGQDEIGAVEGRLACVQRDLRLCAGKPGAVCLPDGFGDRSERANTCER
jgi:hypothetical protein